MMIGICVRGSLRWSLVTGPRLDDRVFFQNSTQTKEEKEKKKWNENGFLANEPTQARAMSAIPCKFDFPAKMVPLASIQHVQHQKTHRI